MDMDDAFSFPAASDQPAVIFFSSMRRSALAASSLRASVTGFFVMQSAAVSSRTFSRRFCITRRRSAVGDDAEQVAVGFGDGGEAEPFAAHFVDHVGHFRRRPARAERPRPRASAPQRGAAFCRAAAGMQRREIVFFESAPLEQRDGQRVAHGHGGGGGSGGREIQRAGFFFHGDVEDDVAGRASVERGLAVSVISGTPSRFTASSNSTNSSVSPLEEMASSTSSAGKHAQVAVQRFGGVQKKRRRAGAGKGGGDFAADQAGFAQSGDHDAAFAAIEEFDGALEARIKALDQAGDGFGLDAQDTLAVSGVRSLARLRSLDRIACSFGVIAFCRGGVASICHSRTSARVLRIF